MNEKNIRSFAFSALPVIVSVLLTAAMTAAAEISGEREIIFPEITAIAIGALAAPVQAWNTSKPRLFAALLLSALSGIAIVRLTALPLFVQVPFGLACAVFWITLLRCSFVPAISACVLPIIMGTRSAAYIASVIIMTALILLAQLCFEKTGIRKKYDFHAVKPDRQLVVLRIKQTAAAAAICFLPAFSGQVFFTAPPLIVAFFELSAPSSKLRKKAPLSALLICSAAAVGTLSRYLLTELAGLPLAVSAAAACTFILLLVCKTNLFFPPCGAMTVLPFLIKNSALAVFPFEVAFGYLCLLTAALLLFKDAPKHPETDK